MINQYYLLCVSVYFCESMNNIVSIVQEKASGKSKYILYVIRRLDKALPAGGGRRAFHYMRGNRESGIGLHSEQ